MENDGATGDGMRQYCAVHRRCVEEWTRWSADGTATAPYEPVIEPEPGARARAADLALRFGVYRWIERAGRGAGEAPGGTASPDAR